MTTDPTGGWIDSARAYINFQDAEDPNRTLLLDPIMLDLCGDVAGKRVLDLGCGEGRFCRMLAERGALCTGIDLISEMARSDREHRRSSDTERADAGRGSLSGRQSRPGATPPESYPVHHVVAEPSLLKGELDNISMANSRWRHILLFLAQRDTNRSASWQESGNPLK